ncbi:hypothetical protein RRG08_065098 [Elysia crispata]|uniref:Uncharacterized protein n=1 Tax=Elysia crispata TaxID=231223 RepID=A0AAE0ZBE4_9GAST|nr:hypothetical protein RRG08_065098 [Elysia crispata]
MMMEVLAPGGRILLDGVNYDPKLLELENLNIEAPVPPPYPVTEARVRTLFETQCEVDLVEIHTDIVVCLKENPFNTFLIVKK